ncbi:hypothetical protein [Bacterioplanoides sp.]|uniref:hypothetical protein n=1 Tax=Bacterioplanoides sp. TaxID=2066072 RepID=UPI003B0049E4
MTTDLTRWNRAGLQQVEYVDGNAVVFADLLRQGLARRFNRSEVRWPELEQTNDDTQAEQSARMQEYYSAETTRDLGIEIARTFARSLHTLGAYINAYANENYLGTASQWDNVRRMTAMLDYHPAPPASAATTVNLYVKPERGGAVAKGELQFKHTPIDGSAPVIFENLEDIDVDPLNNLLRPQDWNYCPDVFDPFADIDLAQHWLSPADSKLSVGQYALVVSDNQATEFAVVASVARLAKANESGEEAQIAVELDAVASAASQSDSQSFIKGDCHCLAVAKDILVPHLNGEGVLRLDKEHGLKAGEVVAWSRGNQWCYGLISAADASQIALGAMASGTTAKGTTTATRTTAAETSTGIPQYPAEQDLLYRALLISRNQAGELYLPANVEHAVWIDPLGQMQWLSLGDGLISVVIEANDSGSADDVIAITPTNSVIAEVFVLSAPSQSVARVAEVAPANLTLDGKPANLASGDWCVAAFADGSVQAVRVETIVSFDGFYQVRFATSSLPTSLPVSSTVSSTVSSPTAALMSGRTSITDPAGATLLSVLQTLQMSLDQAVYSRLTLADIEQGKLLELPLDAIQGVGSRYAQQLKAQTIAEFVRDEELSNASTEIPTAKLWEFMAKARALLELDIGAPAELQNVRLQKLAADIMASRIDGRLKLGRLNLGRADSIGTAARADQSYGRMVRLYCNFSEMLHPQGYDQNPRPLFAANTDSYSLTLAGDRFSPFLKAGRRLMLEQWQPEGKGQPVGKAQQGRYTAPLICTVDKFEPTTRTLTLRDLPEGFGQTEGQAEDQLGFTLGNTLISANVVRAGHGVAREVKVLGSGNAAALNQRFVLEVDDVAFVADAAMPKGVRADIEVQVGSRTWTQVATLRDSRPSDAHYQLRMTEDKFLDIQFGDGVNGRRLPTGNNNVRIGFRSGHGLQGNLLRGSLTKLAKPHRYIDDFRQPFDSRGGNDMEELADLRSNAPLSTLTLNRAVSLADFSNLTQSQASVWQAQAVRKSPRRGVLGRVKVVVVPAGGLLFDDIQTATLTLPDEFSEALLGFLQAHSQPDVDIELAPYTPVVASIKAVIHVKSAEYDPIEVKDLTRRTLLEAFALKQRRLGQALYRSEIYKVVEAITGVEYSVVTLGEPDFPASTEVEHSDSVISARLDQVIYIDELLGSVVDVAVEEYQL